MTAEDLLIDDNSIDEKPNSGRGWASLFLTLMFIVITGASIATIYHHACEYQDNKTKNEIVKNGYFKHQEKVYSIQEYDSLSLPPQ